MMRPAASFLQSLIIALLRTLVLLVALFVAGPALAQTKSDGQTIKCSQATVGSSKFAGYPESLAAKVQFGDDNELGSGDPIEIVAVFNGSAGLRPVKLLHEFGGDLQPALSNRFFGVSKARFITGKKGVEDLFITLYFPLGTLGPGVTFPDLKVKVSMGSSKTAIPEHLPTFICKTF